MKKPQFVLAAAVAVAASALSVPALEPGKTEEAKGDKVKTVAWYTAHIQEARAKNKECFGNPGDKEMQAAPNCVNSLQALKISFSGAN